jgi:hypothetical protein
MVETSYTRAPSHPHFAVHLSHSEPGKERQWTLCERPIGLGDDAVIPYDVVTESQLGSVDCPACLELASARTRRWRSPRRPPSV